jgi:hypothetical protein
MCAAKTRQVDRPAVRWRYNLKRWSLRRKQPDRQIAKFPGREELSEIVPFADHRKLLLELADEARALPGGPWWGLKLAYYLAVKYDPRFAPAPSEPPPRHRPKIKDKGYWSSVEVLAVVAYEKGWSRAKMAEAIATRRFPNDRKKLQAFKRQLENDFVRCGSRDQILSTIKSDHQQTVAFWVANEAKIIDVLVEKVRPHGERCPELTRTIQDLQRKNRNRRRRKSAAAS